MTELEFLEKLKTELKRKNVSDAADIVEEYEQHFAFKLADGCTEEEIAAKLGDPRGIAAQYDASPAPEDRGKRITAVLGLGAADFFFGIFCILLFAWALVMAALALVCSAAVVCLIGGPENPAAVFIPSMPYLCALMFGLLFVSLSVLAVIGTVYFAAFIRQFIRAFGRFHKNTLAAADGSVLPSIPVRPQFSPKGRRVMRNLARAAAAAFAVCGIVCFAVCASAAGALEFWHAWGWFQNV